MTCIFWGVISSSELLFSDSSTPIFFINFTIVLTFLLEEEEDCSLFDQTTRT